MNQTHASGMRRGSPDDRADNTAALVRAAQDGDPMAFQRLVELHRRLVWSVVRSFRLRDADAHDAVQNTWLRMLEGLGSLRDSDKFAGWLASVARRECLKALRQYRREIPGLDVAVDERAGDAAPDPEWVTISGSMRDMLWDHVGQLPSSGRDLLVALTSPDAPPYAEYARVAGMPVGSIGPTRMRYLRKLRQVLETAGLGADAWH